MLSPFDNPEGPPIMSAEAQQPSLFRQGLANFKGNANTPQGKVMMALMGQQLGKMGNMFAPPMRQASSPMDVYSQPSTISAGPVSAPTTPQPNAMNPFQQAMAGLNKGSFYQTGY